MKRVLITGATGFVGRRLIHALQGDDVYVVRAFCRNAASLGSDEPSEVFEGDVLDIASLQKAVEDVDVVIHLAADMDFFPKNKEKMYRTNVEGTRNLADACISHGRIKRFVYVSSTETYGAVQNGPATEESEYHPTSDYGRSKIKAEDMLKEKELPLVILKPSGIYGLGDDFVIFEMMQMVHHGILFFVPGTGDFHLTFVFIDDVVDAIVKSVDLHRKIEGESIILCSDDKWTYRQWICGTADALNRIHPFIHLPLSICKTVIKLIGPIMNLGKRRTFMFQPETIDRMAEERWFDNSKAKRTLGWAPRVTNEEGLRRCTEAAFRRGKLWRMPYSPVSVLLFILTFLLGITMFAR